MLKMMEDARGAACCERSPVRAHKSSAFALVFAIVLMLAGVCAESSLAARGHEFAGAFGWGVLDGKGELQRCTKETGCQTGLSGSGPGQLNGPADIAVNDATGDVYVLDKANNRVEIFNAAGTKFEGEFNGSGLGLGMLGSGQLLNEGKAAGSGGLPEEVSTGRFNEPEGIAVDNDPSSPSYGDVYVADTHGHAQGMEVGGHTEGHQVVDKFSASGEYVGQITRNPDGAYSEDGFRWVYGVAVDSHGEVWVAEENFGGPGQGAANYTNAVANTWIGFRPAHCAYFCIAEGMSPFAVDSDDNFYLNQYLTAPLGGLAKDNSRGELVEGEVDKEEEPTGVAVELTSNDVYVSHASNVHRLDGGGVSLEALRAPGAPSFTGVAVNSSTLTVYAADSADGAVDVFLPEAAGHPTVASGSERVDDVTSNSAIFGAEVNPRSEPGEAATSYSFEYGPCEAGATCSSSAYTQSVPVPDGVLAANYEPDLIGAQLQDLSAHTVYHMRVVAHNSHPGVVEGEELVFTTQTVAPFALPDGRQWELVSPPNKLGAALSPMGLGGRVIEASADGERVTYVATAPTEAEPEGNGYQVQVLSARGASGWTSKDIQPPQVAATGSPAGAGSEYRFFSTDLSRGILQPFGEFVPSLSPEASAQTPFLRANFSSSDPSAFCTNSCYEPLVTAAEGFANVPPGTEFGQDALCTPRENVKIIALCGPHWLGASPDANHLILTSPAPLVEGAPGESLYEWSAGQLQLVSVRPRSAGPAPSSSDPTLGPNAPGHDDAHNGVSVDGSRVVWSEEAGKHGLYLRDLAREETLQIGSAGALFEAANGDLSRILFAEAGDLHECEVVEEAGVLACVLSDLTPSGVFGGLLGVSEDASSVYFTAAGVLAANQVENGNGPEGPQLGQPNVYVRRAGVTTFIATLSPTDSEDDAQGLDNIHTTSRVSPDGRWLAFMSQRPLTGYDNRDAASGARDEEVYLYDSASSRLVCASCNPTGARPHGIESKGEGSSTLEVVDANQIWGAGTWLAASIPGWTANELSTAQYQSRPLSDSGRLFFDSSDALVPQDTNGTEDVYEFEPTQGVGQPVSNTCTPAAPTYAPKSGGCIGLISSGTSEDESAFLDASESGDDVFFLTAAPLSGRDVDSSFDVYDARVDGGEAEVAAAVECQGDACQQPVVPPNDVTPGSMSFSGPGNLTLMSSGSQPKVKTAAQVRFERLTRALKLCRKKPNKQKRVSCEKQARKRYGPAKKGKKQ